jgi:hypothetical protein
MASLDIFNGNAFSVRSLTDNINKLKFVPSHINDLGLFSESSINTTTAQIEEKNGVLVLVPPSNRGGPGTTVDKAKRTLRPINVPHFEINDAIYADEVQNVRAFGSESELETVQGKIGERFLAHTQSMEATQEYSRIGAIKGIITYSDNSTLDLFAVFGVTQEAEIDFDLDNATPAKGALRKACANVVRLVAGNLDNAPFHTVMAECGDAFFDDLLAHPEVIDSYKNTTMAQVLRESYVLPGQNKIFGAFEFGGIVWTNYRGKVGATSFIDTNKCHIFPVGTPGLFRTIYAPADYEETVNTMGQRLYAKQYPMPNGKGRNLDVQMNALNYCTRPKALLKGKRT